MRPTPSNRVLRDTYIRSQRREGAKSKEIIEAALRQNPSLKDSAYYLGRAEMEFGNNIAVAKAFHREVSASDYHPGTVQQAWLSARHRLLASTPHKRCPKSFAMFEKVKDDAAQRIHERLQNKQDAQVPDATTPN